MSQFSQNRSFAEGSNYSYPSMLNPGALSFNPIATQPSLLRPSAPAFVVPTANMIPASATPTFQAFFPVEHESNISGYYDAYVVGGYSDLERDFDVYRTLPAMTPDSMWRPPGGSQSSNELHRGRYELAAADHDSEVDGYYEIDEELQPPTNNDAIQHASPELDEVDEDVSLSNKLRKASLVIKKQANEKTLAKRLGQNILVGHRGPRVYFEGVYWKTPENDRTIPTTDDEKYTCVKSIVAAFRNNEGCKEVSTRPVFRNRWGADATHYTKEELENAAWDIIDAMIHIHTVGWTKKLLDQKLRDQVQKTMYCTFEDRFNGLVKLLTNSKRTCEDLLKSERFYTTIGNPFELEMRTSSNKNSNKRKGTMLKRNVAEMKDEEGGEGGEGGEDVVHALKAKRAKKAHV
ncbi:hypothetical protein HBI68_093450 [Parastagonospora nodorum]|nr:hypothetical protein HBH71_007350 [Parastagonospora nodorum]KAH6167948.1 hypothetical protein HBI68_093450 [Parastagonospora nodorum]